MNVKGKAKEIISTAKQYWTVPPKGNYVPYKEIAYLSGAGFGVHWLTLLASTISLNASNFLVGACIGLQPVDLQIMLNIANVIGIPLGLFRSWYYDNHNLKGGKFLPFIRKTAFPIFAIPMVFVWLPYENWDYMTKVIVVEIMYLLLNVFLCFYNESYTYFQQIISPDSQERAKVLSISQVIYSLAPTITNFAIPTIAGLTWGQNDIRTYRAIYPVFSVIGFIISVIFFRKVKERLILPKKKPEPVRLIDAVREVSKNKYFWITQVAAWVVFLESGYGTIFGWSFVYAHNGQYEPLQGTALTIIGNAALWSMLLAPAAIKWMGKRNLLIVANTLNIFVMIALYFTYKSLIWICVLWYFNTFINTFWNIVQHNISADMRDYHQWKTGVRLDGLFGGPLGLIGTVIGLFTGMVYPAICEKMGLHDDYNVLYDDTMRNNLFEVLIICSAVGAFLNLVPFLFYDLTENKHKAYVGVLRIRTMFEDHALGMLDDEELVEGMEIIHEAKEHYGKERVIIDKSELKKAKSMPKGTQQEKELRAEAIKIAKQHINDAKETNLAIERAPRIIEDLNKFSGEAAKQRLLRAESDFARGPIYPFEDCVEQLKLARRLPKATAEEKEIRSDAIKNARLKKEALHLLNKYPADYIRPADTEKREMLENKESKSFMQSMQIRRELKKLLKQDSVYLRANKPYSEADSLLKQAQYYSHYEELEEKYFSIISSQV